MNRNEVKKVIKRVAVICVAAIMGMSLFACKSKSNGDKIEIPLEQNVNTNEHKNTDNSQQIPSQYAEDTSIAERTTWKKVYHEWPEPPENEKIYTNLENGGTAYAIPYSYKGKNYWIGCNNVNNKRVIYNRTIDNPLDVGPDDRAMIVGADKTEEIWQLLEILEAGDNMVKGVTKGGVRNNTKLGLD